jgi:hypothetical protein
VMLAYVELLFKSATMFIYHVTDIDIIGIG